MGNTVEPTRARTGSDRSGNYPPGTRVVNKLGTTLLCTRLQLEQTSLQFFLLVDDTFRFGGPFVGRAAAPVHPDPELYR